MGDPEGPYHMIADMQAEIERLQARVAEAERMLRLREQQTSELKARDLKLTDRDQSREQLLRDLCICAENILSGNYGYMTMREIVGRIRAELEC